MFFQGKGSKQGDSTRTVVGFINIENLESYNEKQRHCIV